MGYLCMDHLDISPKKVKVNTKMRVRKVLVQTIYRTVTRQPTFNITYNPGEVG